LWFILTLVSTSVEFPICTASGDQLYPDVCWDGEAFWVVWQDEELGTIQGVRISEGGDMLTGEVTLLEKGDDPGPVCYPCVAGALDRIGVEARVKVGDNEFGTPVWGVMHREFTFVGVPLGPQPTRISGSFDLEFDNQVSRPTLVFGDKHFFSLFRTARQSSFEVHMASICVGVDIETQTPHEIWMSSSGFDYYPLPICWGGSKFLVLNTRAENGAFLWDTLVFQGVGGEFGFYRPQYGAHQVVKSQSLVSQGAYFFLVGERRDWVGFDILDSNATPINDSATTLDFGAGIKTYYPCATSDGKNFVSVWENRFKENNTSHLYAIEVDTTGVILKSGYVIQKSPVDRTPAIAFGESKYLLVWSDNHEGEFNIYGMLFDTLELKEAIREENLPAELPFSIVAHPDVFSTATTLYLSGADVNTEVILRVYNNTGSAVRQLVVPRGEGGVVWDGKDARGRTLSAGIYFVVPEGVKARTARVIKL